MVQTEIRLVLIFVVAVISMSMSVFMVVEEGGDVGCSCCR